MLPIGSVGMDIGNSLLGTLLQVALSRVRLGLEKEFYADVVYGNKSEKAVHPIEIDMPHVVPNHPGQKSIFYLVRQLCRILSMTFEIVPTSGSFITTKSSLHFSMQGSTLGHKVMLQIAST